MVRVALIRRAATGLRASLKRRGEWGVADAYVACITLTSVVSRISDRPRKTTWTPCAYHARTTGPYGLPRITTYGNKIPKIRQNIQKYSLLYRMIFWSTLPRTATTFFILFGTNEL